MHGARKLGRYDALRLVCGCTADMVVWRWRGRNAEGKCGRARAGWAVNGRCGGQGVGGRARGRTRNLAARARTL